MKRIIVALTIAVLSFTACKKKEDVKDQNIEMTEQNVLEGIDEEQTLESTGFAAAALNAEFITLEGTKTTFQHIIEQTKGHAVLIDIWATWCPDCIKAFPEAQKIHDQFPDVKYVYLSLDKTEQAWKEGIEKYNLNGEHFFLNDEKRMKGEFGKAIHLNWIPRYIVLDKEGYIALYDATEKSFEQIIDTLKKVQ